MIKILFVDDDPFVLQAMRRMLHAMRGSGQSYFAASGAEALKLLEVTPCEVLITDMRMPQMNGVQLLERVRELYPSMTRIILSGQSDQNLNMQAAGLAHQFMAKPCSSEALIHAVTTSCASRDLLSGEPLRQVLARIQSIPSNPVVYARLVRMLETPTASCHRIAELVSEDPALSAKILQLVNSAFFGLPRTVSSIDQAVGLLGIDMIKALSLAIPVFSKFEGHAFSSFSPEELWSHSVRVGILARLLRLRVTGQIKLAEESFVSGLLHDVGKLLLAANLPQEYELAMASVRQGNRSVGEIEADVFGATHGHVGGFLLGTWGIPEPVVEAVTYHHEPWRLPMMGSAA